MRSPAEARLGAWTFAWRQACAQCSQGTRTSSHRPVGARSGSRDSHRFQQALRRGDRRDAAASARREPGPAARIAEALDRSREDDRPQLEVHGGRLDGPARHPRRRRAAQLVITRSPARKLGALAQRPARGARARTHRGRAHSARGAVTLSPLERPHLAGRGPPLPHARRQPAAGVGDGTRAALAAVTHRQRRLLLRPPTPDRLAQLAGPDRLCRLHHRRFDRPVAQRPCRCRQRDRPRPARPPGRGAGPRRVRTSWAGLQRDGRPARGPGRGARRRARPPARGECPLRRGARGHA